MEGFLFKLSDWIQRWNPRHFSLTKKVLSWQSTNHVKHEFMDRSSKPRGSISLTGVQAARGLRLEHNNAQIYPFVLLFPGGREIILAATSRSARTKWLKRLTGTCVTSTKKSNILSSVSKQKVLENCSDTVAQKLSPSLTKQPIPFNLPCTSHPQNQNINSLTATTLLVEKRTINGSSCNQNMKESIQAGWKVSVVNVGLFQFKMPQRRSQTVIRPIWSLRYSCGSVEWIALRTFADIIEFDIAFKRWLQCEQASLQVKTYHNEHDHYSKCCNEKKSETKVKGALQTGIPVPHHILPILPDVAGQFEFALPTGHRHFVATASNKLLQHSPSNPVDLGISLNSDFAHTEKHRLFEIDAKTHMIPALNSYFAQIGKLLIFHKFMICTGSQPRIFLSCRMPNSQHISKVFQNNSSCPNEVGANSANLSHNAMSIPNLIKKPWCPDHPSFPLFKVFARLKPGDIFLFNIRSRLASVQRLIFKCFWDHVGIVTMTRADERLHLLEATQQGVTCLPLRQRLTQYAKEGAVIAARIFSWQYADANEAKKRYKHTNRTLRIFVHEALGAQYGGIWDSIRSMCKQKFFSQSKTSATARRMQHRQDVDQKIPFMLPQSESALSTQHSNSVKASESVSKPIFPSDLSSDKVASISTPPASLSNSQSNTIIASLPNSGFDTAQSRVQEKYFCSNLVALALVKLGVLANVSIDQARCYLPRAFEPGGIVDIHLTDTSKLGPPILCYGTQ